MTENEALLRIKDLEYECVNSTIHYYTDKDIPTLQLAQKALEEIQQYREIGTVEEFKTLKEYKEKMEMQYLNDMDNPLEPIKLSSALQSEILKYNYRKEHKPQDINILDYTIMYALKYCLEEQLEGRTK